MYNTIMEYVFFGLLKDFWYPIFMNISESTGSIKSIIAWAVLLTIIITIAYQISVKQYVKLLKIVCVISSFLGIGTIIVAAMGLMGGWLFYMSMKLISTAGPIEIDESKKSSWNYYERRRKLNEAEARASSNARYMSEEERRQMDFELRDLKEYTRNYDGTDDVDEFLKRYF